MNGWMLVGESGDVFDALQANHRFLLEAEVRELSLIAQACDEYTVDLNRADEAAEKIIDGGAEGTARVGEFLALELAGLLQASPTTAALRIRETLDLRDRHPELWAFVMSGSLPPWQAFKVSSRCSNAGLSGEAARWVDHQLGLGLGALPWGRLLRSLEGLIVKADSALAAKRAEERRRGRRVFIGDHIDGGSVVFARMNTADAIALDETITDLANVLTAQGSTETMAQRRATALGILADRHAALGLLAGCGDGRPTNRTATLVVHIAADSVYPDPFQGSDSQAVTLAGCPHDASGPQVGGTPHVTSVGARRSAGLSPVARVEGVGPLDLDTLRLFLADSQVIVRPVIDPNALPPTDAYEIPDRLRQHVLARNPVEVFPYSARSAKGCDLDHTVPYDRLAPPGWSQTTADNLGPLSRKVHRAKTSKLWTLVQWEPGCFTWTSPHWFRYEVTPEGTRRIGRLQIVPEPSETWDYADAGGTRAS